MPSRLSSLVVRDGLVGVKRMEMAFQRQVIYGGCLDTILLEMSLVPEERLVQYLSLATGLPPATRSETNVFDADAIKTCTPDVAKAYRVVPLCFEEGALRVLVHDPVDMVLLEKLADEIDVPVQPLVVPEYRFHIVFARMFGGTPHARFSALGKRAEDATPSTPVGRSRTVIVEDPDAGDEDEFGEALVVDVHESGPLPVRSGRTREMAVAALTRLEDDEAGPDADMDYAPLGGATVVDVDPISAASAPVRLSGRRRATARNTQVGIGAVGVAATTPSSQSPTPPMGVRKLARRGTSQNEPAGEKPRGGELSPLPLDPTQARELLDEASDRDLIFGMLLRAIRYHCWYAGLLTVQGAAAIGRIAIAGSAVEREQIAQVLIPLDVPSAFHNAVSAAAPHIGPIATGDIEIDGMITRMGEVVPPWALVLPVVLRNRVVALAIGHNRSEPLDVGDASELLPLASVAADAISRLIVKNKAAVRQLDPTIPVETPAAVRTIRPRLSTTEPEPLPAPPAPGPIPDEIDLSPEVAISMEADEPDPIALVLSTLQNGDAVIAEHARFEALSRSDEVIEAAQSLFPGALRVDRYELGGRAIPADRHGPLLALLVQLGAPAVPLLIDKMRDNRRDIRYYATLCISELRPATAVGALVERIFDSDYGIRDMAIEALARYSGEELESGLVHVRQALSSQDPERIHAAAMALATLGDVRAIPDLLDAHGRGDRGAEHARLALVQLVKQDFGTSTRKWRAWWAKHKRQNRVEWLIDGLAHNAEPIRRSAVEELRKLTGEHFGFQADMPKRDREQARQRWLDWWEEIGRTRFLRTDEQHRETGLLPNKG